MRLLILRNICTGVAFKIKLWRVRFILGQRAKWIHNDKQWSKDWSQRFCKRNRSSNRSSLPWRNTKMKNLKLLKTLILEDRVCMHGRIHIDTDSFNNIAYMISHPSLYIIRIVFIKNLILRNKKEYHSFNCSYRRRSLIWRAKAFREKWSKPCSWCNWATSICSTFTGRTSTLRKAISSLTNRSRSSWRRWSWVWRRDTLRIWVSPTSTDSFCRSCSLSARSDPSLSKFSRTFTYPILQWLR